MSILESESKTRSTKEGADLWKEGEEGRSVEWMGVNWDGIGERAWMSVSCMLFINVG